MVFRRRRRRNINGILLLDKPLGLSSNEVLQKVKHLFNANRAGHTGALDPLASGMLPICFGEATKFSQFLLDADKCYHVIARLGQRTNTSDAEGSIIVEREVCFNKPQLDAALEKFRGQLLQVPSMYSALKHQGKPLYEYARQGLTIERKARHITVFTLQLIRWQDNELELRIHCSKGTYIRTIIDDLGELLGCGAHVIYLRRSQVSVYSIDNMVTLAELNIIADSSPIENLLTYKKLDELLLPLDSAVYHLPEINLSPMLALLIQKGQSIQLVNTLINATVRITVGDNNNFIGIGTINNSGCLAPKRLICS